VPDEGRVRLLHRCPRLSGCATRCACQPNSSAANPGDPPVWFRFLGCNARHHSLALAPVPADPGIVHLMIETGSLDDVGPRAGPVAPAAGATVSGSLGAGTPTDLMVSFYVAHPGRLRRRVRQPTAGSSTTPPGSAGEEHRRQPVGPQLCPPRADLDAGPVPAGPRPLLHPASRSSRRPAPEGPAGFRLPGPSPRCRWSRLWCCSAPAVPRPTWPLIERAEQLSAPTWLADGQAGGWPRRFGITGGGQVRRGGVVSPRPSGPIPGRRADLGRVRGSRPVHEFRATTSWSPAGSPRSARAVRAAPLPVLLPRPVWRLTRPGDRADRGGRHAGWPGRGQCRLDVIPGAPGEGAGARPGSLVPSVSMPSSAVCTWVSGVRKLHHLQHLAADLDLALG